MKDINLGLVKDLKGYERILNTRPYREQIMQILDQDKAVSMGGISIEEKIKAHKRLLMHKKSREIIHNNLGVLYQQCNKNLKARRHFICALKIKQHYKDAIINLANSYALEEEYATAEHHYRRVYETGDSDPKLMTNLGSALVNQGKADECINILEKVLKTNPSLGMAHYILARAHIMKGNTTRARDLLNKILEKNRFLGSVQRTRAACIKFTRQSPELQEMESIVKEISRDSDNYMHIHFALGKAYEDIGNYDKAFEQIKIANTTLRKNLSYDWDQDKKKFSANSRLFNQSYFSRLKNKVKGSQQRIIFIVGLPRCGSTLIHQILSMHSQVKAVGESTILGNTILSRQVKMLQNPKTLQIIQQEYLEHLGDSKKTIVDKNLYNFFWIPLIKILFPNAIFISIKREVSGHFWSMFKNYFSNGNEFTTSLRDIYNFHDLYYKMLDQWKLKLGIPIYSYSYDRLVVNKEKSIKELLNLCQLPWEYQCMNFTKSSTPVQTASAVQVRKDIYKSSSEEGHKFYSLIQKELNADGIYF